MTALTTPQAAALAKAAACYCYDARSRRQVFLYLLASIAGGSMDPRTLQKASTCYCYDGRDIDHVVAYLLCAKASHTAPSDLTPAGLGRAAACLALPPGNLGSVMVFLYNAWLNGLPVTCSASNLVAAAACANYSQGEVFKVILYLLAQIAGNTQTPAQLATAAACFEFPPAQIMPLAVYLLTQALQCPIVAYDNEGLAHSVNFLLSSTHNAASFTAPATGALTNLVLEARQSTAAPTTTVTITLYPDSGGAGPTANGTVLASVAANILPTTAPWTVPLATQPLLQAGKRYWIDGLASVASGSSVLWYLTSNLTQNQDSRGNVTSEYRATYPPMVVTPNVSFAAIMQVSLC